MKDNCLDIGIIQAFLDCELDQAETARVSGHISMCNDCAVLLAQAEDESSMVFSALEREFNTLVPTQRLWNKINDSIETERETRPFWEKAWAGFVAAFASPSLVAAAGLLIVVGVLALIWTNRNVTQPEVAGSKTPTVNTKPAPVIPQESKNVVPAVTEKPLDEQIPTIKYHKAQVGFPAVKIGAQAHIIVAAFDHIPFVGPNRFAAMVVFVNRDWAARHAGYLSAGWEGLNFNPLDAFWLLRFV